MIWVYVAAAIFGCAFLLPMVLGGLDSGVDGADGLGDGLDMDVDVEVDVDLDAGDIGSADAPTGADLESVDAFGGGGDPFGAVFASLLSFRTVVFFAAFFGTSGIVFDLLGYSPIATAATAVMIGLIAAVANSLLFGLIKSSQSNSQISDRVLEGRPARVVLPMSSVSRGRIRIDLSGQPHYVVAKPAPGQGESFDVGDPVVVVSFENGTAQVASLAELDAGPDGPSATEEEQGEES